MGTNGTIESTRDLDTLRQQITDRWSSFKLSNNKSVTPAQLFAGRWTAENANVTKSAPGWLKAVYVVAPAVASAACAVIAFPVGLIVPAIYAATIYPLIHSINQKNRKIEEDKSVTSEAFPIFQDDLQDFLEAAVTFARTRDAELEESGTNIEARMQAKEEVADVVRTFVKDNFKLDPELVEDKPERESTETTDYQATNLTKRALADITSPPLVSGDVDGLSGIGTPGQNLGKDAVDPRRVDPPGR